jgi:hypothetical protein
MIKELLDIRNTLTEAVNKYIHNEFDDCQFADTVLMMANEIDLLIKQDERRNNQLIHNILDKITDIRREELESLRREIESVKREIKNIEIIPININTGKNQKK